jgi:hypothetical protein
MAQNAPRHALGITELFPPAQFDQRGDTSVDAHEKVDGEQPVAGGDEIEGEGRELHPTIKMYRVRL